MSFVILNVDARQARTNMEQCGRDVHARRRTQFSRRVGAPELKIVFKMRVVLDVKCKSPLRL